MTPRLFIDCSSTITCEFNTGIQRVVRNLCEQAWSLAESHDRIALPVFAQAGKMHAAKSLYPQRHADLASYIAQSQVADSYRKLAASILQKFPSRRLEKLFLPKPGHAGIFKVPAVVLNGLRRPGIPPFGKPEFGLHVQTGDILLMADASWMIPNWTCVERVKSRGALIGNVIYDLIPLTHPQFFQEELVTRFAGWFERAARSSDFFLCISEHVASQVRQRLQAIGRSSEDVHQICRSFPLGANLMSPQSQERPAIDFEEIFTNCRGENPHLVVGTLEPRKNHGFILDAFDRLWKSGSTEKLCIVGRVGWNCEATLARIQKHVELGRKLFLFHHATDADLSFAYRQAKSLVMASHAEGFGLPILEALDFNQRVLASDTAIHREVGGDRVSYFSINSDCDPLIRLLRECEVRVQSDTLPQPNLSAHICWSDSFAEMLELTAHIQEYLQQRSSAIPNAA